jgi:iron(II)-dependent oxidoreductase
MQATILAEWVRDARQRTFDLVADLSDEQLMGPQLAIINPLLWEIGHVAWFQEKWVLRHALGRPPIRRDVDNLYDSAAIAHDTRWDLSLPSREQTLQYMREVRDRVLESVEGGQRSDDVQYFVLLSIFHEDMHTEAFTYTRQTLGYPPPRFTDDRSPMTDHRSPSPEAGPLPGDVEIPGGTFQLGATPDEQFIFDNEKWAHPVQVRPFAIARAPVTQAEFAAFVDDGGYKQRTFWSDEGWRWRESARAEHPVYWQGEPSAWLRRHFDQWVPLEPHRPVIHVNRYEADAYCRWACRRLPTETEWEFAAAGPPAPATHHSLAARRDSEALTTHPSERRFPWGEDPATADVANLDWQAMGCVDVAAFADGDSRFGCRQMIGNVWEWTASTFLPYPGFVADPYKEYSEPWFGTHQVLRGGCWVTRSRLLRNTWRNFYTSDRRDVWAGFRTCRNE